MAATLALVLALGGGAYAATSLPAGSVGTRQLARGAVTPEKLSSSVGLAQATGKASPTLTAGGGCGAASCPPPLPVPRLSVTVKLTRPSKVLVYGSATGSATAGGSSVVVRVGANHEPGSGIAEQTVTGDATIGGATTLSLPAGKSVVNLYVEVVHGGPFELSEGGAPTALTVVALPALAG